MERMWLRLHTVLDNRALYLAGPVWIYLYPELDPEWLESPSSIFLSVSMTYFQRLRGCCWRDPQAVSPSPHLEMLSALWSTAFVMCLPGGPMTHWLQRARGCHSGLF